MTTGKTIALTRRTLVGKVMSLLLNILSRLVITFGDCKLKQDTTRGSHKKCWAGESTSWNQDAGRNINNLRYTDNTTLMAGSEKELKSLFDQSEEESKKYSLKLNIQKMKIMASSPITSWQVNGETMKTVTEFILGAPKSLQMLTAVMKLKDTCSLEEKL